MTVEIKTRGWYLPEWERKLRQLDRIARDFEIRRMQDIQQQLLHARSDKYHQPH